MYLQFPVNGQKHKFHLLTWIQEWHVCTFTGYCGFWSWMGVNHAKVTCPIQSYIHSDSCTCMDHQMKLRPEAKWCYVAPSSVAECHCQLSYKACCVVADWFYSLDLFLSSFFMNFSTVPNGRRIITIADLFSYKLRQ